jgi:hypothetical protein
MKPTFALDFRDGQITLLHRTSRGWSLVGSATFGAPDFDDALAYLRSTAMGLSPRGITTKLILPEDQILYTTVEVGSADPTRRRRLIRLGLEGRTPYPVDDLAWDWSGEGDEVQVAVIARETMAEAESFAVEHRFNPVSFVAVPPEGAFAGEPFFGMTAHASQVLGEGEKVERDTHPVVQVLAEAAKPEAGPAITEADFIAPEPDLRDLPEEEEPSAPETPAIAAQVVHPVAAAQASLPLAEPAPVEPVKAEPAKVEPAKVEPPKAAPVQAAPVQAAPAQAAPAAQPELAEAPMAVDVEDDLPPAPAPAVLAARKGERPVKVTELTAAELNASDLTKTDTRSTDPEPGKIGGVSRPGASPAALGAKNPTKAASKAKAEFGLSKMARSLAAKATSKAAAKAATSPASGTELSLAEKAAPLAASLTPQPVIAEPVVAEAPVVAASPETPALQKPAVKPAAKPALKPNVTATTIPGLSKRDQTKAEPLDGPLEAKADPVQRPALAKPAMKPHVIKGRPPIGGKPRYLGVALTVGLLFLLAAIAVWSALFMGTSDTAPSSGTPESAPAAALSTPANVEDTVAATDANAGASAPAGPETSGTTATPPEAIAAATPAPMTVLAGGIRLAGPEAPPSLLVPQTLPALSSLALGQPAAAPSPPPFGTVYKFDADGRIIPTPEGILTPDGVLLVAGKPAKLPPEKPEALRLAALNTVLNPAARPFASEATGLPALPNTPDRAVLPDGSSAADLPAPPFADPTLAGKRPRLRPAEVVVLPPSPEELRLAGLRPAARPAALVVEPEPTPEPGAAASLMASGAPLLTAPVTRAPRPASRPTDLSRAVNDAVTAALDQPEPTQVAAAQPAPEIIDEPEPETHTPSLPTNASVAKQATTKDAINTRRLALLAVFGTSSNRFAMVRQPNGAVKRIKVGDALDGGRVAAITSTTVQYQKGGRMLTLQLPTG